MTETMRPDVVVAGGGLAALELVLALRELAGERVRITIVAPEPDFVLRPLLVAEPLGEGRAQRRPLREIADELGARLVPAAVAAVEPALRRVMLRSGATIHYDTLVLAPGARQLPAFEDAIHIGDEAGAVALHAMREEIRSGDVSSVAFVAPTLTGWLLPLYEAALITAGIDERVMVSLVTAEQAPLTLFGREASAAVADQLRIAGVEFVGGCRATVSGRTVVLHGEPPTSLPAERVVSLPLVCGPGIAGVPATELHGLIPVDPFGRVTGLDDAYAVGDATDFPIKQGGLACQQADAAAEHIAARHGAPVTPEPFHPRLSATLLTGGGTSIALGSGGEPGPGKAPGRHLGPYLAQERSAV